ncbi:MAG: hypothetical protein KBT47_04180, partial [Armatimonadetes bacterium]|nr:hypothetical protein [Candidatus Hippobium faecium]
MKLTPIIRYYFGKSNRKRIDMNALDDMKWKTSFKSEDADFEFSFSAVREVCENVSVGVQIEFNDWSKDNYVLLPAAAYNGNRFVTFKQDYPPLIRDKSAFRVDMPVYQNDVPRLNIDPGNSIIQQLAGDMSIPCIGVFFPKKLKALFLFGTQQVKGWETGYEIEESLDREKAFLTVIAPGVRSGLIYKGMQFSVPSPDKPAHFEKGDEIILPLGIYYDDCTGIDEFFELFVKYRENYHKNEIINDLIKKEMDRLFGKIKNIGA